MNRSRRTLWVSLGLGLIFLAGLLFPAFIQDNFVMPLALLLWLAWRVLQSVDQNIYWVLLMFAVVAYFFARLYRSTESPPIVEKYSRANANATLERINAWKMSIRLTAIDTSDSTSLENSLAKMLAALYAARQSDAVMFEIYDALKLRQIPLPETVYAFLFPDEPVGAKWSVKRLLRAIRAAPRKYIRRWTGRETADYYLALEHTIAFMEAAVEHTDADDKFDTPHN